MFAWLISAPCLSRAATSSRSPAEQAAINTAPWLNRTLAPGRDRLPAEEPLASVSVRSVSEPSHLCSCSCRRCFAASDRERSVAAIFLGLSPGQIQLLMRGERQRFALGPGGTHHAAWRTGQARHSSLTRTRGSSEGSTPISREARTGLLPSNQTQVR